MSSGRTGGANHHIWVVDRIESGIAVMVRDDNARQKDVPLAVLPADTREGAVLRVPETQGRPLWSHAVADEEIRLERLQKAEEVLKRLRARDPGGNVAL